MDKHDDKQQVRVVGRRKSRPITLLGSAEQLKQGARFSEEIHRLSGVKYLAIERGQILRFKSHEDANQHWEDVLVDTMVKHRGG